MTPTCAPVVLLGYRRPEHTERVFQMIRQARPATLFLVMDGPKTDAPGDKALVEATRAIVEQVDWECDVHRVYADTNMGLKRRVSSGFDQVFNRVDSAIILEDDCLPSSSFFPFASELLELYKADSRVGIVSGTQRLGGKWAGESSYLFSQDVRIWGWATWARTWKTFRDSGDLEATWTSSEAREVGKLFSPGPRRNAMVSMMSHSENLDSWALPFAVHCATRNYLNPIPQINLIHNIGLGHGSTHTGFENYVVDVTAADMPFPLRHPPTVRYSHPVDKWESARDQAELFLYPLRHPLDTARRLWRFGSTKLSTAFPRRPL